MKSFKLDLVQIYPHYLIKMHLDLICRKVSSISGDVRRVLQICSQTLDMAQLDKLSNKVTLEHVQKTFERLYTSTRTIFIR